MVKSDKSRMLMVLIPRALAMLGLFCAASFGATGAAGAGGREVQPAATQPNYDPQVPPAFVVTGPLTKQEKASLAPTLVTINPKSSTVVTMQQIEKLSGIDVSFDSLPREAGMFLEQRPVFEALIKLANRADRVIYCNSFGGTPRLMLTRPSEFRTGPSFACTEAFLGMLSVYTFESGSVSLNFQVVGESRCPVWTISGITIERATDARNNAIVLPQVPRASRQIVLRNLQTSQLNALDITVRAWVPAKLESAEFNLPLKGKTVTKTAGPFKLELEEATSQDNQKLLDISVYRPDGTSDEQWRELSPLIQPQLPAPQDGGSSFSHRGSHTSKDRCVVTLAYYGRADKLSVRIPSKLRELDIPFSFSGIEIPPEPKRPEIRR